MRVQPAVERGSRAEADFAARRAGLEQHQHRGQQRDARHQRDDHPEPGDDAELGDADVIGRQERAETEEHRPRGKRERRAERGRGTLEGCPGIGAVEPLGVEAHRDLDAEIDPEPDEQRNERDRDQIERADREQPERGRDHEPRDDRHDDPCDDLHRARREPQGQQHRGGHHQPDEADILLERRELLVGERDFAGGAYAHAVRRIEPELAGLRDDRGDRVLAGLQRAVIELGLREDQPAARRRGARTRLGEQLLPRKIGGLARRRCVERSGHRPHRTRDPREGYVPALDSGQHRRERSRDPAQRRIASERPEQRLRADQRLGRRLHLGGRAEQQPFTVEIGAAIGSLDAAEMRRVRSERGGELGGRGFGEFGGLAVDDHQQHVGQLRERGLDRFLILSPGDLGRDQRRGIGRHREMTRGKDRRPRDEREAQAEHRERTPHAERDELLEQAGDHLAGAFGPMK